MENAWLKEKLRQKEAKLDKATEHMAELLLRHQKEQVAHQELRKEVAQLIEENRQLEKIKEELLTEKQQQQQQQQQHQREEDATAQPAKVTVSSYCETKTGV